MRGVLKHKIGTQIGDLTISKYENRKYYMTCGCGNVICGKGKYVEEKMRFLEERGSIQCSKCTYRKLADLKPSGYKLLYPYKQYQHRAKIKNIEFTLTKEEASVLFQSKCFYCNALPGSKLKTNYSMSNKEYVYFQGIDRIDSSKGYTMDNVVPCCKHCNTAKMQLSYNDFIEMCKNVYLNHVQRLEGNLVEPSGSKQATVLNN